MKFQSHIQNRVSLKKQLANINKAVTNGDNGVLEFCTDVIHLESGQVKTGRKNQQNLLKQVDSRRCSLKQETKQSQM